MRLCFPVRRPAFRFQVVIKWYRSTLRLSNWSNQAPIPHVGIAASKANARTYDATEPGAPPARIASRPRLKAPRPSARPSGRRTCLALRSSIRSTTELSRMPRRKPLCLRRVVSIPITQSSGSRSTSRCCSPRSTASGRPGCPRSEAYRAPTQGGWHPRRSTRVSMPCDTYRRDPRMPA
jgi:hypothetical protein